MSRPPRNRTEITWARPPKRLTATASTLGEVKLERGMDGANAVRRAGDTEGPRLLYESAGPGDVYSLTLVLLFTRLFPVTFPRECFLDALPLSGLQVEGVTFYFLDDVLLLHLPLKTTQCILERLAFLHTNLCQ